MNNQTNDTASSTIKAARGAGSTPPAVHRKGDLLHTWSALWLWCLPVFIEIIAVNRYDNHAISSATAGILLTTAVLWIGLACFVNAIRCGRVHCWIDGTVLPLLSVFGIFNLLHVVSFGWVAFTNIFTAIVILSFVAEYVHNKVRHQEAGAGIC